MAYSKQTWADGGAGGTPLSAARLNYIENGILVASDYPLGHANNPVTDPNAARPNLGPGIAVWWRTATTPVNMIDGDIRITTT